MDLEASNRGKAVPRSAIRKLIPLSRETEKRGVKIIRLNIGQPDIETPPEFWKGVRAFKEKVLAYSPSEGRPEYLDAQVKYYARFGIPVSREDMVASTGGIEGVLYALMAATDPGDDVLVPEPYYSNYIGAAAMAGVRFVAFTTFAESGYHLPDCTTIEKAITPKTKAILFSNPGNPTGCVYTKEEVTLLGDIGKQRGLFVISDEVYREFVYNGVAATSILRVPGMEECGVILDSASKRYSVCGGRVGTIVSKNKSFMDAVRALATVRLSAPTLDQIGVAACIKTPKSYFKKVIQEYIARRDIVVDALSGVEEVVCHRPEGAFYVMAKLKGIDTEDFSRWLLTDFSHKGETVMVAPGAGFYATPGLGRDEIRIAYVFKAPIMKRAMEILVSAIREYRSRHK